MSIIEQVLINTRKAEDILKTHFKAEGRGMHEKLSHAERYIPEPLLKKLRYVATIRNKLMHELDFELSEPEIFIDTAHKAINELEELAERFLAERERNANKEEALEADDLSKSESSYKSGTRIYSDDGLLFSLQALIRNTADAFRFSSQWVFYAAVIFGSLFAISIYMNEQKKNSRPTISTTYQSKPLSTINDNTNSATPTTAETVVKTKPAPSIPETVAQSKPVQTRQKSENTLISNEVKEKNTQTVTPQTQSPEKPSASTNTPTKASEATALDWRQEMEKGKHTAIPNNYLEITNIRLSYRQGSFRSMEPFIEITVKNKTELNLSSAKVDARLYINGQNEPAIDTSVGRSRENLYIFFDEYGLKPNSTVTTRVSLAGFAADRWKTPDILNASNRQLILNLTGISDGMKQNIPIKSPGFDELGVHSGLDIKIDRENQVVTALPDISKLKTVFNNGGSVGIGNADLEIQNVKIQYTKGSFNRYEPNIQVTVRNQSDQTLSSGYVHARLYLNNGKTPVFTTQKPLYIGFGERGLMSGETRTERVYIGGFDDLQWVSPDILNAQNRKVMLKLESLRDGMERTMQSQPASFFEP